MQTVFAKSSRPAKEEERPHLRKAAPPKARLQIFSELLNKNLSVFRPPLPLLFGFHDAASDLPVGVHHEGVHASSGSASGGLKQRDNIVTNLVLFRW